MAAKKGFSLIEITIVIIIMGILVSISLPNYYLSLLQGKIEAVENNLRSIAVAEQKYYEDYGVYCTTHYGAECGSFNSINQKLSLSMSSGSSVQDGFVYSCTSTGTTTTITCPISNPYCTFTCKAVSPSGWLNETVSVDANGNLTCGGVQYVCPTSNIVQTSTT